EILAIGWVPRVPDAERARFEQGVREAGRAGFSIRELSPAGPPPPPGRPAPDLPHPPCAPGDAGGPVRAGLRSPPTRGAMLARAASGRLAAVGPLALVGAPGDRIGFLMAVGLPTTVTGVTGGERAEPFRDAPTGFVTGVVLLRAILDRAHAAVGRV